MWGLWASRRSGMGTWMLLVSGGQGTKTFVLHVQGERRGRSRAGERGPLRVPSLLISPVITFNPSLYFAKRDDAVGSVGSGFRSSQMGRTAATRLGVPAGTDLAGHCWETQRKNNLPEIAGAAGVPACHPVSPPVTRCPHLSPRGCAEAGAGETEAGEGAWGLSPGTHGRAPSSGGDTPLCAMGGVWGSLCAAQLPKSPVFPTLEVTSSLCVTGRGWGCARGSLGCG